jgi:hypothetical protein
MNSLFIDEHFKPTIFGLTTVDIATTSDEAISLLSKKDYDVLSISTSSDSLMVLKLLDDILTNNKNIKVINFHGNNKSKNEQAIDFIHRFFRNVNLDIYTVNKEGFKADGNFIYFVNNARANHSLRANLTGDYILLSKENLRVKVYPDYCEKYNCRIPEKVKIFGRDENFISKKIKEGYDILFNPFTDTINFSNIRRF